MTLLAAIAAALILSALFLRRWGRAPVAAGIVLLAAFGSAGTLAAKVQTLDLWGPIAPPMAGGDGGGLRYYGANARRAAR